MRRGEKMRRLKEMKGRDARKGKAKREREIEKKVWKSIGEEKEMERGGDDRIEEKGGNERKEEEKS